MVHMNRHTDQHPQMGGAMTLFSFVNQLRPQTGHPRHWEVINLFFLEITFATMSSDANSSNFVTITSQTEAKWATAHGKSWPRQETGPQVFVAPQNKPQHAKG